MIIEDKLVMVLGAYSLCRLSDEALQRLISGPINWAKVLEIALQQKVAPLVYENILLRRLESFMAEDILAKLKGTYYLQMAFNAQLLEQAKEVVAALSDRDIPVVPFKGIDLAERLYHNIGLRPMTDIDILVQPQDAVQVSRILNGLGYEAVVDFKKQLKNRFSYACTFERREKSDLEVSIDLHWHVLTSTWMQALLRDRCDMRYIWDKTRPDNWEGFKVRRFSQEHCCLASITHAFSHTFEHLIMVEDIALLMELCSDLQSLIREARQLNILPILTYTRKMLCRYANLRLPVHRKRLSQQLSSKLSFLLYMGELIGLDL